MPDKPTAKKSQRQILFEEISEGKTEIERPWLGTLLSAFVGGMEVGFSVLVMAALSKTLQDGPMWVRELAIAGGYAVGFVLVILGRSELFTEHTTLATLPVLARRASIQGLARQWGTVYAGNIAGTAVISAILAWFTPDLDIPKAAFETFAHRMTDHPALVLFTSAVLAGWLMGLLSWLVAASRETMSQIVMVFMITGTIGLAHLHHSIVGSVEVLVGVFGGSVTLGSYGWFLLWSTLGNAVGGVVFVALLKWAHARRVQQTEA